MNTKNNKRRSQTDEKLKKCYSELFIKRKGAEISVSELCGYAGINRATFYARYEDIIDFECSLAGEFYRKIHSDLGPDINGVSRMTFLKLFSYLYKGHKYIRIYLGSAARNHIKSRIPMQRIRKESIDRLNVLGPASRAETAEFYYRKALFNDGLIGIIIEWINNNCKESPDEMARYVVNFEKDLFRDQQR